MLLESLIVAVPLAIGAISVWCGEVRSRKLTTEASLRAEARNHKYSPTVELVLELLNSEPDEWTGTGYIRHPTDVKVYNDTTSKTFDFLDMCVGNKLIRPTKEERYALGTAVKRVVQKRAEAERDSVAKALAQRILDRKQSLLDKPGLGNSACTESPALASPSAASAYLTRCPRTGQIIQTMSGDSVKLVLDSRLKERYGLVR